MSYVVGKGKKVKGEGTTEMEAARERSTHTPLFVLFRGPLFPFCFEEYFLVAMHFVFPAFGRGCFQGTWEMNSIAKMKLQEKKGPCRAGYRGVAHRACARAQQHTPAIECSVISLLRRKIASLGARPTRADLARPVVEGTKK